MSNEVKRFDAFVRGVKKTDPLGTALFTALRALDPVLQYVLLSRNVAGPYLQAIGLDVLPNGPAVKTGIAFIDALGLDPYRLTLLAFSTVSAARHIYWILFLNQDLLTPKMSVVVGLFNAVSNAVNSVLGTLAFFSPAASLRPFPQTSVIVGGTIFATGSFLETFSEWQRKKFKQDPKNEGKAYTGGLWSLARHINYTGYALWRGGYVAAAGGYTLGAIVGGWFINDFRARGIPILDEHCSKKYGEQWAEFKRKTPYMLVPGLL